MSRGRRNDEFHGWRDCTSFEDADAIRREKKADGLAARVTDLGGWRDGDAIKPHRVSWWPQKSRGVNPPRMEEGSDREGLTQGLGASFGPGSRPSDHAPAGHGAPRFDPSRDDYEDTECWNCGGEGYVYGCSWDWQCDTYDAGEGTCLCTRRCHVCHPPTPHPELQQVLAKALRDSGSDPKGENSRSEVEGEASQSGHEVASPNLGGQS